MPSPKAQYKLQQLISDAKSRKFKYIPKEKKPIDWASYTEAQLNEMSDYFTLVRNIIDEICRDIGNVDQGNVGRPPKSCFNLTKAILMQQYLETSNRVTAGWLRVLRNELGITENLTYKDIERAYENPKVIAVLRLMFDKTNEPAKNKETKFAGDGTGIPTSIKQNYEQDKDDDDKIHLYDRMVGIIGTEYKLLAAVEITEGHANESPFVIPLLKETKERYAKIDAFAYDGAAYSLDVMTFIESIGAKPRILPPLNAVIKAHGCMAKKHMLLDFIKNTQQWLREYHIRSVTESKHSAEKRVFTRPLLRRIECRRYVEGYVRACRYNIRQLVYVFYLNGLDVRWLSNQAS